MAECKKIWVRSESRNLGMDLYSNLGSLEMTGIQAVRVVQCLCFVAKRKNPKETTLVIITLMFLNYG